MDWKRTAIRMAELSAEIYGEVDYLRTDGITQWAYVEADHALVFRGTDSFLDWAFNDDREPSPWVAHLKIHRGFSDYYSAIEFPLNKLLNSFTRAKLESLRITGHSLGASTALIVASMIEMNRGALCPVYSFGSPKTFSSTAPLAFKFPHYRFIHGRDIVPSLPLFRNYRHYGEEIHLNKPRVPNVVLPIFLKYKVVQDHLMKYYLEAVRNQ